MKPATAIEDWSDWPEDVVSELLRLNHSWRLRFPYNGEYVCIGCKLRCEPHRYGDAVLDGVAYCDDCLISLVRWVKEND